MIFLFYVSGFIAIVTTICVMLSTHPIYALLFLISSLLSISFNLFSLQAPFAGAIEVIIYAGAIMVLFIFAIMMLNIKHNSFNLSHFNQTNSPFLSIKVCFGIILLMSNLLIILLYAVCEKNNCFINIIHTVISFQSISTKLLNSYMLVMEMASFLLLSALISVVHIAQEYDNFSNFNTIQLSKLKK